MEILVEKKVNRPREGCKEPIGSQNLENESEIEMNGRWKVLTEKVMVRTRDEEPEEKEEYEEENEDTTKIKNIFIKNDLRHFFCAILALGNIIHMHF